MSQQHFVLSTAPVASVSPRGSRARFGVIFTAIAALSFGALAFGNASPAVAHDQLVSSEVVAQADGTAEAVQLTFNNSVIEMGTEFVITAPDGSDATAGVPVVAGPDVTQPIAQALDAGDYAGAWSVVSSDGHRIEGVFTLTLDADGSGVLAEGVAPDAHEHEHEHEADGHEHEADGHEHDSEGHAAEAEEAATPPEPAGIGSGSGSIITISAVGIAVVGAALVIMLRRRGKGAASQVRDNDSEGSN